MVLKWILFFFVLNFMDAHSFFTCDPLTLVHGRVRLRAPRRMARFSCFPGYDLIGSRYMTCRNGHWDKTMPVCVKSGCEEPNVENSIPLSSRGDAWVTFFCMPGFVLQGSPSVYCDGQNWNSTMPKCVASTKIPKLSCDFEDPGLCGWTQDVLHDFDWERLSRKTPSSFLNTGPSYDHTLGAGQGGYYMYIESSSRMENTTARLLSPVYEHSYTKNGCFSFYYHMYGKYTGGLRVYQKPDSIPLSDVISDPRLRDQYLLFEMWGNQGDFWWGNVADLKEFTEDFQIVIEGIRGKKFTSDIAIDDVAIYQGEKCAEMKRMVSTPMPVGSETCEGRCRAPATNHLDCLCQDDCWPNCCQDYMEMCVFNLAADDDTGATTEALPQTQKLIAKTTTTTSSTSTTTTTTTTTTPAPTTPEPTTTTVIYPTTKSTTAESTTMTPVPTKAIENPTTKIVTTTERIRQTTRAVPFKPIVVDPSTVDMTYSTVAVAVSKSTFSMVTSNQTPKGTTKREGPSEVSAHAAHLRKGNAWMPVLWSLAAAIFACLLLWGAAGARGARGRAALARLRGRVRHDPEVRYLHQEQD